MLQVKADEPILLLHRQKVDLVWLAKFLREHMIRAIFRLLVERGCGRGAVLKHYSFWRQRVLNSGVLMGFKEVHFQVPY
jgi:hypothetical protein